MIFNNKGQLIGDVLDLNKICDIDYESKPILGFQNPMITACFNHDENIFFAVHHRMTSTHYNFIYSYKDETVISKIDSCQLDYSTILNFPNKSFFNE